VSGRTRVAVLVDRIHEYQVPVIRGMESALHAAGAFLFVVVSHPLHVQREAMLRQLVQSGQVQGIMITAMGETDTARNRVTAASAIAVLADIPCVTIGIRLPDIPVVLAENVEGVQAAMTHLLDDCGRRHPLLMAGDPENDDSREREGTFRALAAERNLSLPRVPVAHGNFEREPAYRRITQLLAAGRDFDAVLAANDDMAMGILDALHEHGIRVPETVAVIGFDNVAEAYRTDPPLTTVDIELTEQGKAAVGLLLAQLEGLPVPEQVRPSAHLMIRLSTLPGVSDDTFEAALAALVSTSAEGPTLPPVIVAEQILATLSTVTAPMNPDFRRQVNAFTLEWASSMIEGTLSPERSERLTTALTALVTLHPEPLWWRGLTAALQRALAKSAPDGRVNAVNQAGVIRMIMYIERALILVRERLDREQLSVSEHVLELNRGLSGCRSLLALTQELSAYLPRLNVRRCFMVLLEQTTGGPPTGRSEPAAVTGPRLARLAMSYRDGVSSTTPDQQLYSIDQLLPPSLAVELEHGTLTVQPLFNDDHWFGILLHEQTTIDRHTAEALRLDASRVLDTIGRARELTERASELEALVKVRTEQLELEVAIRRAAEKGLSEANTDLRRAILLDGLTGLQNRPSFDEHLARAWQRHLRNRSPLSVLMVDIDHFKFYNDTYGHLAGDDCLRQVAAHLRLAVPRKQDIVARFGGEEFAVILPDTDAGGAFLVAERLLEGLRAAAISHSGSRLERRRVSASIGVGSTDDPVVGTMEELVDTADQAMYAAKHNGRDQAMMFTRPAATLTSPDQS